MSWLGLDRLIAPLRPLVAELPKGVSLREAGATIVAAHYGDAVIEQPSFINLGVLAVQSRGRPATYFLRPSASRVVHETDLRAIPSEPPHLLRAAGVIEARRPETGEVLWGNIAALGWYPIKGADMYPPQLTDSIFLMGLEYPDGSLVARWTPAWTGEDLVEQLPSPDTQSSLIAFVELARHNEFARQAARFLTIFGLLAEVKQGPLRFELESDGRTRQVRVKDLSAGGMREDPKPRPAPLAEIDPSERVLGDSPIKGHLQRYRTGERRSLVEWRYVEGYTGRRWFAPRWTVERDHGHSGLANSTLAYKPKGGR